MNVSYSAGEDPQQQLSFQGTRALGRSRDEGDNVHAMRTSDTLAAEMPMLISERVPLVPESTFGNDLVTRNPITDLTQPNQRDSFNQSLRPREDLSVALPPRQPLPASSLYKPQGTIRRRLFNFERAADIEPSNRLSQSSMRDPPEDPSQSQPQTADNTKATLTQWLKSLGVRLPPHFTLEAPVLNQFRDGLLLCDIVSSLEKRTVEGVSPKPQSAASALHNIRRALTVLEKKNAIPIYYAYSAEGIYEGSADLILGLLKNMRHAYKNCGRDVSSSRRYAKSAKTDRSSLKARGRDEAEEEREALGKRRLLGRGHAA